MPVLFLLRGSKWVFRPAGATHCHNKREIWHAGGADRSPCQISRLSGQKCGNTATKLSKFQIWPYICSPGATRLHYFYEIPSVCTRLQVAFKFLVWSFSGDKQRSYKHFPVVGAFSHKFSIASSRETTDRIRKS